MFGATERHADDAEKDCRNAGHFTPANLLTEHPLAGYQQNHESGRICRLHNCQRSNRQGCELERDCYSLNGDASKPALALYQLPKQCEACRLLALHLARLTGLHNGRKVEAGRRAGGQQNPEDDVAHSCASLRSDRWRHAF